MRVNVANTITHWLLLLLIGFLLVQFSNGQVTVFNSVEASQNDTFLSYDFDGHIEPYYEVTGVAVALVIGAKCDLTSELKPWQPPEVTPTTIVGPPNKTVLLVDRDNMIQSGCQSYKQPDHVAVALVGRDVGAQLWNQGRNAGVYYVTVEQ
ncbi:hypothetical protein IWQ62_006192, partial [Dispira parvispora]